MTAHEIGSAELVRQLRRVGVRPSQRTIDAILERGDDAVPPLLELTLDMDALRGDEPASLGPVHALRLLGELKPAEAARPILEQFPLQISGEPGQGAYLWIQEAPQIVARFGAEILPLLTELAEDAEAPALRRAAAYAALEYLAVTEPSERDAAVELLRSRLNQESDDTARAYIVNALAQLQVRDAYAEVMQLFREKRVDREFISAADARQLLLGGRGARQIECALHTLDERYAQHGPFTPEQQQEMAEAARGRA